MSDKTQNDSQERDIIKRINEDATTTWFEKLVKIVNYIKENKKDDIDISSYKNSNFSKIESMAHDFCTSYEKLINKEQVADDLSSLCEIFNQPRHHIYHSCQTLY